MKEPLAVGIVGATGYGGAELIRFLLRHPYVRLTYLTSETYQGQAISEVLPHLRGYLDLTCQSFDPAVAGRFAQVLFLALQNGRAMQAVPFLLEAGCKVIDLSADYRLKDPAVYSTWYQKEHTSPHLLSKAVYGIPELYREEIQRADLIANPGCYPTSVLLGLAPLLKAGWVDPKDIVVNSASGVSGAGRSKFGLEYHFPEVDESLRPYAVEGHRHRPEMEQEIHRLSGKETRIVFVPHLVPMIRGILSTMYVRLTRSITSEELQNLYESAYQEEPFVQVLPPGHFPSTKYVWGSNQCHLSVTLEPRTNRAIVISAIDNLGKGMVTQAIQNMNLMMGWPETTGIDFPALYP